MASTQKKAIKIWHPYLPEEKEKTRKPKELTRPSGPTTPLPWCTTAYNPFQMTIWSKMEQQKQHFGAMGNPLLPFGNSFSPMSKNPLVTTPVGNLNDLVNTCAHCGASFRLTSDLVQHMRSQHRKQGGQTENHRKSAD